MLRFALDIVSGMQYLSDNNFIHRDLASRNCMLDTDFTAKVSDFGLTRQLNESEYYRIQTIERELPIKWMALEVMESHKYTTQSDMVSLSTIFQNVQLIHFIIT